MSGSVQLGNQIDVHNNRSQRKRIRIVQKSNGSLHFLRDPELVKRIGAATALEVRATGISYVFAPCIAVSWMKNQTRESIFLIRCRVLSSLFVVSVHLQVCRDPRWGRCYESYSEDPKIVQAMTEIVPGLQGDIPADSPKGIPFVAGQ